MVDDFWRKHHATYLEDLKKLVKWKHTSQKIAEVGDVVALLDKPTKTGDYGLAVVEKIFEKADNEPRELLLRMARPARRDHPYPLNAVTTKSRRFKRHAASVILVVKKSEFIDNIGVGIDVNQINDDAENDKDNNDAERIGQI